MKNISIILIVFSLMSCNRPKCDNEIQDGDETGIDCGGECTPCLVEDSTPKTYQYYPLEGIYISPSNDQTFEFRNDTLINIYDLGNPSQDTVYYRFQYEYNRALSSSTISSLQIGYPDAHLNTHSLDFYDVSDSLFTNLMSTEFLHVEYDNALNKRKFDINYGGTTIDWWLEM